MIQTGMQSRAAKVSNGRFRWTKWDFRYEVKIVVNCII